MRRIVTLVTAALLAIGVPLAMAHGQGPPTVLTALNATSHDTHPGTDEQTTDHEHVTTTDDKDHHPSTTDDRDVTTTDDKDHHPSTTDDKDHHPSTTDDRDHHPTTTCPEPDREDRDHPATTDDKGSAENAHPPSSHDHPDTTADDKDHHPTTTDDKDHKPPEDCEHPPHHTTPPTVTAPPTSGPPITTVVTFPPNDQAFAFGGASTVCRAEVPTIVIDFRLPGIPALAGRTGTLTMTAVSNPSVTSTQTIVYEPGGHVELLYPGTSVNPDGSIADVPGWILQPNGLWVLDPSDAFLRDGIHLSYTVNPTAEATVTYPPESSICANPENPPGTPGGPGGPGIPPAL